MAVFGLASIPWFPMTSSFAGEGSAYYDVIQEIEIPFAKKTEAMQVRVNLERQNDLDSFRRILFLAVLYMARVWTELQKDEMQSTQYENERKANSVWIMKSNEEDVHNEVSPMYMNINPIQVPGDVFENMTMHYRGYDSMECYLIRMGEDLPVSEKNTLQKMEDGNQLSCQKMTALFDELFADPVKAEEQDVYTKDS